MSRITYEQIQHNIAEIANRNEYSFDFIFDLLLAYGKPKTTVTRLRNGIINFDNDEGGVLLKDAVFFRAYPAGTVLESKVESLRHDSKTEQYRPRFLIATDYTDIAAYDRKLEKTLITKIRDLDKEFLFFFALSGNEATVGTDKESVADRRAAEHMKSLYEEIEKCNSERIIAKDPNFRHDLNVFFSRLLFCYFAEDTELFEPKQFTGAVKNYTAVDGSDLPNFFEQLFKALDSKPYEKSAMPDPFNKFPYVNGTIFDTKKHSIAIPKFNAQSRHLLIELAESDWSDVNPDIFGTIFQGIVDERKRDENGMDYTSVVNIEKVINPLFMDELWGEYEKILSSNYSDSWKLTKLDALWRRIGDIKIFDPACGSGNFLIIAYKRLRELEQYIIRSKDELSTTGISVKLSSSIRLDHFFGIEIDDFPRELAVLSMYIAAHQMNIKFEEEFGKRLSIIPIEDMPTIVCGNSARIDWSLVCPNEKKNQTNLNQVAMLEGMGADIEIPGLDSFEYDEIYVIGNPPYKGSKKQSLSQKSDFKEYFQGRSYSKNLDYIALWFLKGADYIKGTKAKLAFVSTNSVCQGEHVGAMFPEIISKGIEIGFAYRSFKWSNNAKDNAGVTVVIISLCNKNCESRHVLYYGNRKEVVGHINPYLLPSDDDIIVCKENSPINESFPSMRFGSQAIDGGNLLLSENEYRDLVTSESGIKKFIKKAAGSAELIKGLKRYCIWVNRSEAEDAKKCIFLEKRFRKVADFRKKTTTSKEVAPYMFSSIRYSGKESLLVPRVSSERRPYIPMAYVDTETVILDSAQFIEEADLYIFALLESRMHTIWIRSVCGKLETRLRYSSLLGYNAFPAPQLEEKIIAKLRENAIAILEARENHPEMTLGELYDPEKMPADLANAHRSNDDTVDRIFSPEFFQSDDDRLACLLSKYSSYKKRK